MKRLSSIAAVTCVLAATPTAHAAYQFSFIQGAWGAADATLGLAPGAVVEDFEDVQLIAGLAVKVTNSSNGAYGPTGVLPATFNPNTGDPFGGAFVGGNWDGSRVLLNTGGNASANYFSTSAWGDVSFGFAGGATQVGFSLQQMQQAATVTINGSTVVSLGSVPGFAYSGSRLGYLRIDVTGGSAPITSLTLDGTVFDAWTVDHLAVTSVSAVPEPAAWASFGLGLALMGLRLRRRG